jgi:hypothetical protein
VDTDQDLTPQAPEPNIPPQDTARNQTPKQAFIAEMTAGLRAMAEMIERNPQVAVLSRRLRLPTDMWPPPRAPWLVLAVIAAVAWVVTR